MQKLIHDNLKNVQGGWGSSYHFNCAVQGSHVTFEPCSNQFNSEEVARDLLYYASENDNDEKAVTSVKNAIDKITANWKENFGSKHYDCLKFEINSIKEVAKGNANSLQYSSLY